MLFLSSMFSRCFEFHDKAGTIIIIIIIAILVDIPLHTLASVGAEQRFFLVNEYILQKAPKINDNPVMCCNPAHT